MKKWLMINSYDFYSNKVYTLILVNNVRINVSGFLQLTNDMVMESNFVQILFLHYFLTVYCMHAIIYRIEKWMIFSQKSYNIH